MALNGVMAKIYVVRFKVGDWQDAPAHTALIQAVNARRGRPPPQ